MRDLVIGLCIVALLITAKVLVEGTKFSRRFNTFGYEVLHSFIPNYDPERDPAVIVLDISSLPRSNDGSTPNESLRTIIDALVESQAKAIAIDINFAPGNDPEDRSGSDVSNDLEFFDFLQSLRSKGVHVFVGVHKFSIEPEMWLGLEEHHELAADMTLNDDDTSEIPAWVQCQDYPRLRSISAALAEASGVRREPVAWMKRFLAWADDPENLRQAVLNDRSGNPTVCQKSITLVNYAKLELVQKLILQTLDRDSIVRARDVENNNRFKGKLVLIGNAQRDAAADKFVPSGRNKAVPGVFLHAMAANTLVADPVYKLKHWVTLVLDGLLGAFVVVGLFLVRLRYRQDTSFSPHPWENRFVWLSIAITLALGFIMVRLYNVLWLDFLLVVFALLLHSKVHHLSEHLFRKLFGRKSQAKGELSS